MQDVVIPNESGRYLVSTCKYIDTLLVKFYGKSSFYNVKNTEELIGHLIIGLAPHTSVGIGDAIRSISCSVLQHQIGIQQKDEMLMVMLIL